MNDSKNNPKPLPPDDFSATVPNFKVPKQDSPSFGNEPPASDWEKTNYNYSRKDLQPDEWNKTAYNTPKPSQNPPEWGRSYPPNPPPNNAPGNAPKEVDWGATQANIKLPNNQPNNKFEPQQGQQDFGSRQPEYGATTPLINLPDDIRQKYQAPPPVKPAEPVEEEKKGGIPGWAWATAGLVAMFLFAVVVLLGVKFLFLNTTGFDLVIKGAPLRSDIKVDGSSWKISTEDGNYSLLGLKANETKKIEIVNAGFNCTPIEIKGADGEKLERIASCAAKAPVAPPVDNSCKEIKKGDFAKAAQCANTALDSLGENFTVKQLLDAMNLYIINFDSGKFDIKPNDMQFLTKASGYMKKLPPNTKIEVGGHTDNVGNDVSNQKLSENRAKSVRDAFVTLGVKPEMLEMRGYGKSQPKADNSTEDGKFRNRRIEYTAIIR